MTTRLCFLAALALTLPLTACGDDDEPTDASTDADGGGDDGDIQFDANMLDTSDGGGGDGTPVGTACTDDSACAPGSCITEADSGWSDGYCTEDCTASGVCTGDSVCVQVGRNQSLCLDSCEPGGERTCRAGYGCSATMLGGICIPGCVDESDCGDGQTCNPAGGQGGEGECFTDGVDIGDECPDDDACGEGQSCIMGGQRGLPEFPGGMCSVFGCEVGSNAGCGEEYCLELGRGFGLCLPRCEEDTECRDGYRCGQVDDDGVCFPGCRDDSECADGERCAAGECQRPLDPTELGEACSLDEDACEGGVCLREFDTGFPGSYCITLDCDLEASDEEDGCPGNGVCVETDGGGSACVLGCTDGACERGGYDCIPSDDEDPDSTPACLPACTEDSHCANDGWVCNLGTGRCNEPVEEVEIGPACSSDESCEGGTCLSEQATGYPGGMCVLSGCRLSGEGPAETCPEGSVCAEDYTGSAEFGSCVTACRPMMSADCRAGFSCETSADDETVGFCVPDCATSACVPPLTCDAESGRCLEADEE